MDSLPDSLTTQQLLEDVRWFRLVGSLRISLSINVEIYVFPGTEPGRVGLDLKLGSRVFEAVHAHDPDLEDWNEEAKQDLLEFCVGVARTVHADGFMFDDDDGELTPFTVQAGLKRMRREHNVSIMEKWSLYKEGKPYSVLWALPLTLLVMLGGQLLRPTHLRHVGMALILLGLLSVIGIVLLDRLNILVEYETWLARGMPDRPF